MKLLVLAGFLVVSGLLEAVGDNAPTSLPPWSRTLTESSLRRYFAALACYVASRYHFRQAKLTGSKEPSPTLWALSSQPVVQR